MSYFEENRERYIKRMTESSFGLPKHIIIALTSIPSPSVYCYCFQNYAKEKNVDVKEIDRFDMRFIFSRTIFNIFEPHAPYWGKKYTMENDRCWVFNLERKDKSKEWSLDNMQINKYGLFKHSVLLIEGESWYDDGLQPYESL